MTPIDATPLDQVDTLDLLREYDARLAEPQTLGVRTRLAAIETEIRRRAFVIDLAEPAVRA